MVNEDLQLYINDKSRRTKTVYLFCAKKLDAFLKKQRLSLRTMQPVDVKKFVLTKRKNKTEYSKNTQALFKEFALAVLRFVGRDEYFIKTVRTNLRETKTQSNFKVDLTPEEITRLISVTKSPELKLGFSVMAFNGLRAGEFLGLHYSDINKEKKTIHLRRRPLEKKIPNKVPDGTYFPKGMKLEDQPIKLPLNDISIQFFEQLVFKSGERIYPFSYKTLRKHFNKSVALAKITRTAYPITPHKLRHFFGHYFTKHKGTIQELKSLLRHSDLKYTLLYSLPTDQELEVAFREVMKMKIKKI